MGAQSGGGLSGLAFAIALQRYASDVEYEIYEGASQLSAVGAGVGIQPRIWTIMQALGLEEALLKISGDDAESSACFLPLPPVVLFHSSMSDTPRRKRSLSYTARPTSHKDKTSTKSP